MKKGLIFSLLISIIGFLGLSIFAFIPKTTFSYDKIEEFNKFESSLISELQNDDYSYTEINKNVSLSQLKEKVEPNSKNSQATIFSMEDNKILTPNQISDYCYSNNLTIRETETSYLVRNKFGLKRLIINGTLPNNHNAKKVISYDDMHILCYNTIDETKNEYTKFLQQKINVEIDNVVSTESTEFVQAQSVLNNWSEHAIDIASYSDYRTDKEIVVVVLDTGINTLHEIFKDRFVIEDKKIVGTSYYSSSYTYNKENIQLTTINGIGSNLSFEDDNGHGTHVAGIIASQTPKNVKIIPMRVINKDNSGSTTAIYGSLKKVYDVYSEKYHVACTNLSLGTPDPLDDESLSSGLNSYNKYFSDLKSKNILNIVAAGNKLGNPNDTAKILPAACGDTAIVVSALKATTNSRNEYTGMVYDSRYSNFGTSVDISAPGTSINSAWKASSNSSSTVNQTKSESGTSMATPHVSAAVAKLCLDNDFYTTSTPSYTASQIEDILFTSTLDLGDSGKDKYYGHGALRYTNLNAKTEPNKTIYHTANNATFTYDGNYHNISINVTQPTSGYTIKYSLENNGIYNITNINGLQAFKNANDSAITVYYQISAPDYITVTGSKTLKINPKDVEISISNTTSIYGNSFNTSNIKYSCSEIVNNDNLGVTLNISKINFAQAGTYDVTYDSHTNTNYNITNKTTKGSHTVQKRTATINIDDLTSTYGENFTLDQLNYSVAGLVNGDTISDITLSTNAVTGINPAGSYTINATYTENNNYSISVKNGTLTINKKSVTICVLDQTSVYGEVINLDQTKYIIPGLIRYDTIQNIVLSTTATNTLVGNYDITATYTSNNNYSVSVRKGTYSVTKRSINLESHNQTFTYGDNIILDQTKYLVKSGSFAFNDQTSVMLSSNATTNGNAGSYDINLTFNNSDNYNITLTKGKAIINKRVITIEITNSQITNQTIEYGDKLSLEENSYILKSGTILEKDKSTFKISLKSQPNPNNTESYLVSAENEDNNYYIVLENNEITVVPRKLSITIPNQYFEYGNSIDLTYTITSGSFARNDKVNDQASVKLSTTATNSSALGEYDITITFNNIDKYDLTLIKGKAVINPRQLNLEIKNQNFTYGDPINLNQLDYIIKSGSFAFNDQASVNLSTSATQNSNANEYAINVQFNNMDKYALTINNGKAIINPRPITISTPQSKVYGEENNLDNTIYTIEEGSVIDGTDLELTFTSPATKLSPVGDYEITLQSHNPNYAITIVNSYLTINPKLIEIYVSDQSGIYGDVVKLDQTQYSVDLFDLVGDSDLGIILSTDADHTNNIESYSNSANKPKPVGNYTISATTTNPNYILDVEEGTFTINKRKISIRLYDQSVPHTFNFTYNKEDYDIMSGSIVGDDNLNITLTTNATAMSFAGDYDIIATYLNENYDVTFTNATLTLEFSYVDALMILVPTAILVLVATLVLVVFIKRKNKSIPLYKKWTK